MILHFILCRLQYKQCTAEDDVIKWFWNIVTPLKEEEKALLMKFSTGSPCVPLGGFAALTVNILTRYSFDCFELALSRFFVLPCNYCASDAVLLIHALRMTETETVANQCVMVGDLVEVGLKSKYTELLKLNHLTSRK